VPGFSLVDLVVFTLLAQALNPDALIGRWDDDQRSRGGIGIAITFAEHGKCSKTTGVMVDGRWTFANLALTRTIPIGSDRSETAVIPVKFTGKGMIQSIDGESRTLERIDDRGLETSVEGVWSYPHPAGGIAYEVYETGGRFLFRLPAVTEPCSWSSGGHLLQMTVNSIVTEFKWNVTQRRLTLESEGQRQVFHRGSAIVP